MGYVDILRSQTLFKLKTKGREAREVKIEEIPSIWSKFMDTSDNWIITSYPDNSNLSGCLYEGKKGSYFDGHYHKKEDEIMTVLNKTGFLKVYTPEWSKEVRYGESVFIERGLPHYVDFKETTLFTVVWHPAMKGWKGKFINNE